MAQYHAHFVHIRIQADSRPSAMNSCGNCEGPLGQGTQLSPGVRPGRDHGRPFKLVSDFQLRTSQLSNYELANYPTIQLTTTRATISPACPSTQPGGA